MKSRAGTCYEKDVNAPAPQSKYIPLEIITEYKVVKKSLRELGLTEEWLCEELKKTGYRTDRASLLCRNSS